MLGAGEVVGVAEVGILATVGSVSVQVVRRPHVAVLSTGEWADQLRELLEAFACPPVLQCAHCD